MLVTLSTWDLGCSWQDGALGSRWRAEAGLLHPGMRAVAMRSSAAQGSVYPVTQWSLARGGEKGAGGGHGLRAIETRLYGVVLARRGVGALEGAWGLSQPGDRTRTVISPCL